MRLAPYPSVALFFGLSFAMLNAPALAQSTPGSITQTSDTARLTNNDVLEMLKSGLPSEIIIAKIAVSECDFDTSPATLKELKAAAVPDDVVLAMVKAPGSQGVPPAEKAKRLAISAEAAKERETLEASKCPSCVRVLISYIDSGSGEKGIRGQARTRSNG